MSLPNFFTSGELAIDSASVPASMSTWLAVTTIAAICASLTPWANATGANANEPNSTRAPVFISTPHGLIDSPELRRPVSVGCRPDRAGGLTSGLKLGVRTRSSVLWSPAMDRRQFLHMTGIGGAVFIATPARVLAQLSKSSPGAIVDPAPGAR